MTAPVTPTTVEGVQIVPLRRLDDERGAVLHMLKATDPHFAGFGEIYFSSVYAGVVKGWKRHRRMTANYACILGRVRVVIYDGRDGSPTHGTVMEMYMGPDEYALVVIPAGVWHGFQGVSPPVSIVANCATEPSDPAELDRLDPADPHIPYEWQEPA